MFRVTAQNCKQWANEANEDKYIMILEEIAVEARAGKYSMYYNELSDIFITRLKADGFQTTLDGTDGMVLISWQ
jgi:hypothetical protein